MDKRTGVITSVCAALALGAGLAGCAGESSSAAPASGLKQLAVALNANDTAAMYLPEQLSESLPNTRHAWSQPPGLPGTPASDSVVRGRVVEVVEHSGFIETGAMPRPGRPGATRTDYTDPKASWRAVRVTVEVAETLAGPAAPTQEFYLGLLGHAERDDEAATMSQTLQGLGEVVVISERRPSGSEFLGMTRVLISSSFGIAAVDETGSLSFPFADPEGPSPQEYMAGVDTLEELRAELSKAPRRKLHQG